MKRESRGANQFAIILAYDGRRYFGWQRQKDHPSVQGAVEDGIFKAFGVRTPLRGASRTDRGAHAEGQVGSFRMDLDIEPLAMAEQLNAALPSDVRVVGARTVPEDFHPRMDAVGKAYEYRIVTTEELDPALEERVWHVPVALDAERMQAAADMFIGEHDFATFMTRSKYPPKTSVRDMEEALVEADDEGVTVTFQANAFLNHMVRNMVWVLAEVGDGRRPPEDVRTLLNAKKRAAAPKTAPASGLYLKNVFYDS